MDIRIRGWRNCISTCAIESLIPGVSAVVLSEMPLISGSVSRTTISVPGYLPPPRDPARACLIFGSDGYLPAMGIPLLLGRDLSAQDTGNTKPVVVVNETFVNKYLDGANPIGRTFTMNKRQVEIVGLCKDAKYNSLRDQVPPVVYINYLQLPRMLGSITFNIRTQRSPATVAAAVRGVVSSIDPGLPISEMQTEEDQIARSIGPERFFAGFAGAFGLTAVLLAALGLYGALAFSVARRTAEIGIRLALGAERRDVLWLVLRGSLLVVLVGFAVGLSVALAATRLLTGILYGIKPGDPVRCPSPRPYRPTFLCEDNGHYRQKIFAVPDVPTSEREHCWFFWYLLAFRQPGEHAESRAPRCHRRWDARSSSANCREWTGRLYGSPFRSQSCLRATQAGMRTTRWPRGRGRVRRSHAQDPGASSQVRARSLRENPEINDAVGYVELRLKRTKEGAWLRAATKSSITSSSIAEKCVDRSLRGTGSALRRAPLSSPFVS